MQVDTTFIQKKKANTEDRMRNYKEHFNFVQQDNGLITYVVYN